MFVISIHTVYFYGPLTMPTEVFIVSDGDSDIFVMNLAMDMLTINMVSKHSKHMSQNTEYTYLIEFLV